MNKQVTDIGAILNLRSNDSIGEELANRQLEAITKSYQYLSKPGNNIIYIADEVGLGKTYIAAGIAMLFRHFSHDVNNHKDLIIVPKKNLQDKWKKELKNFVNNNYLCADDLIKQQYNFDEAIKDRLMPIRGTDPISIFRMTSFSSIAATQNRKSELYDYLLSFIFKDDEFAKSVLDEAWHLGFFNKGLESSLRKLLAYLMNALSPQVNCLIIDEAHNYKYGIGGDDYDESIRNETTARFLGAVKDNYILSKFPRLKAKVKLPLAKKIICLSATPKDRSLLEIRNQFNCFSNSHILTDTRTAGEIEARLKRFLLRGNLEYVLNADVVSRNQCRVEHRKGNVNKSEVAIPLTIEDSFDAVFWQLLQYKSIKHLDQKNNASFEIGMLASFETYMADLDKRNLTKTNVPYESEDKSKEDKEYEQTAHRSIQESHDINIIRGIMASYYEKFKKYPPHPKQTKLEDEIIEQLKRQEKALIFVRRVASSYELEKRIKERFESEIVVGQYLSFTGKFTKYKTPELHTLLSSFNDYHNEILVQERLDDTLRLLLAKDEIKRVFLSFAEINEYNYNEEGLIWLRIAFESEKVSAFKASVSDFIKRSLVNISQTMKDITTSAILETYGEYKRHSEKDDEIDSKSEDPQSGYFFLDYFKKGRKGFYYRQKMYRENWFEINLIIFNNHFRFIDYSVRDLNALLSEIKYDPKKKKNQSFKLATVTTFSFFLEHGILNENAASDNSIIPSPLNETTFITRLLCEFCDTEMRNWLQRRLKANNNKDVLRDLNVLSVILKNILRNGSGLLPGFIADSTELNFNDELLYLVTGDESPFFFVLQEIKAIINDFDLIVAVNFQEREEGKINAILRNLTPIVGTSGQDDRDRGILASQFRMPGFPYVLITTDIFREGEDLHTYCQNVYHYGIAWNPSDMEQRTGRIDRINSKSYRKLNDTKELSFENKVHVFYPYLRHSVEVNQVVQLLRNLNKFVETFNDIVTDNKYESAVSINDEIIDESIPAPITKRLKSKYDIHDFEVN